MGKPIMQRCNACGGSGSIPTKRQQTIKGVTSTVTVDEDCKPCDGAGRIVIGEEPEPGSRK